MHEELAKLVALGEERIHGISTAFVRDIRSELLPESRLQLIAGSRGVGKTTLVLQHARLESKNRKYAYLSLDEFYFESHALVDTISELKAEGYQTIILDEIHLYETWSRELKNCYDRYPNLNFIATGSSALQLFKGEFDLSRRADLLKMPTLSFREFLWFAKGIELPAITWEELATNPIDLSISLRDQIKVPLQLWREFLSTGAYPGNVREAKRARGRLLEVARVVIERDLQALYKLRPNTTIALRKLLALIAESVPFKPNISKLATSLEVSRNTVYTLLSHLHDAHLIISVQAAGKSDSLLNKPEKIFLGDVNLASHLSSKPDEGNLRETFFITCWPSDVEIRTSNKGDFEVAGSTFEIGGKNKTFKQIKDVPNSYLAIADQEIGYGNRIPLWVFGFLR